MSDKLSFKFEAKDLMVLAAYRTLKDFNSDELEYTQSEAEDTKTMFDPLIDDISEQFKVQFNENLKQCYQEELQKHLSLL